MNTAKMYAIAVGTMQRKTELTVFRSLVTATKKCFESIFSQAYISSLAG